MSVPNTQLYKNISSSVTTITVINPPNLAPSEPGVISIDSEQIHYQSCDPQNFFGCTRGYNSTSAASHTKGTAVVFVSTDSPVGEASLSGTAPIAVAGGTNVLVGQSATISITKADATHDGYLAQADWNTFNGKLGTALSSAKILVGNGSNVAAPVSLSGDATLANTGALTLANTAVTPASYTNASVTVDSKGRVTAASSGTAPVTSVSGTTNDITSTGGTTPVLDLANTAVTPGSYTNTNLSVDAKGRITAASSGSGGGATVTSWATQTATWTGAGTPVSATLFTRRVGDTMEGMFSVEVGTPTAVPLALTIPGGLHVDTTKVPGNKQTWLGFATITNAASPIGIFAQDVGVVITEDSSDTTKLFFVGDVAAGGTANVLDPRDNGSGILNANDGIVGRFSVPILEWA